MTIRSLLTMLTIFFTTGMLLFASCSRYDGTHAEFMDKKYDKIIRYFTKNLDLDENQQTLFTDAAKSLKDLEKTFHGSPTIREEMYSEFRKNTINKSKVNDFIKEKVASFEENSIVIVDKLAIFQESLTTEQREKFITILEKYDNKSRHYRWKIGL